MRSVLLFLVALLYSHTISSAEYSFTPSDMPQLAKILKGKLKAGDIVYLEDGVYKDFQVVFKGNGSEKYPITLKARNVGKVILTGALSVRISGDYLTIDGFVMKDGMAAKTDIIEFRTSSTEFANYCRLTNSVIDNCNNPDPKFRTSTKFSERWIMLYGKNNRIDHCYFTNKINGGVLMMVNIKDEASQDNNHKIDCNFFSHRPYFTPENNAEIIRLGDSYTSQLSCKSIIENNYFLACDGEVEIISIKSCDNILRKNVFYESQGALVCRHGHRNTIEGNVFIGNGKQNTAGVRIINQGHRVFNNLFQDLVGTRSYSALCVMAGVFELPTEKTDLDREPLNAYHRVKDVEICHNTFINCQNIDLGTNTVYYYSESNPIFPSKKVDGRLAPQCIIANNVIYNTESSNVLNLVHENTKDISFYNNVYNSRSKISVKGFVSRKVEYLKSPKGASKGLYKVKKVSEELFQFSELPSPKFEYVKYDIFGNLRDNPRSIGAYQVPMRSTILDVVKLSEVGVSWYTPITVDREYIFKKTDL